VKYNLTKIAIWAVIIGVAFAFAWWKGYIERIRNYCNATIEELKKCSWPTREELKGSTVVVVLSITILGLFTFLADYIFMHLVRLIS
jgi:preprotein translocase subunit SecE